VPGRLAWDTLYGGICAIKSSRRARGDLHGPGWKVEHGRIAPWRRDTKQLSDRSVLRCAPSLRLTLLERAKHPFPPSSRAPRHVTCYAVRRNVTTSDARRIKALCTRETDYDSRVHVRQNIAARYAKGACTLDVRLQPLRANETDASPMSEADSGELAKPVGEWGEFLSSERIHRNFKHEFHPLNCDSNIRSGRAPSRNGAHVVSTRREVICRKVYFTHVA